VGFRNEVEANYKITVNENIPEVNKQCTYMTKQLTHFMILKQFLRSDIVPAGTYDNRYEIFQRSNLGIDEMEIQNQSFIVQQDNTSKKI
jgi:hypothetical protein